jgi:hypothetical protein
MDSATPLRRKTAEKIVLRKNYFLGRVVEPPEEMRDESSTS